MSGHNDNYVHNDEKLLSVKLINIQYKYKQHILSLEYLSYVNSEKSVRGMIIKVFPISKQNRPKFKN
jgi:hypothetical protein